MQLHAEALEKLLSHVHEALGERSPVFFARLCEDPVVESVLCLHGLHPVAVEKRVEAALDAVRPYLKSHAGGVELLDVTDDVAHVRLSGTCDGCPSSTVTLRGAVERAILERVPEVREVRAEGDPATAKTIDLTVLPFGA